MSKLLRQNVGGTDFTMAGCTLTGVCSSAASDYIKSVTLSDGDILADGMTVAVTFANGNTAGTAPASLTIYSSDQVNYYSDSGLTQPFTLAPSGCYEIEYTGTGNAYTYTSYPVIQIAGVTAPVCDSCGKKTSGAVWDAGDTILVLYSGSKFMVISGLTNSVTAGSRKAVTSDAVASAMSSLPTDAVLHYSFDEVPNIPDGTANERNLNGNTYNVSFSGNGTITTDPYVAGDNKIHKSDINGNANFKSDLTVSVSRGVYRNLNSLLGKVIIVELLAKTNNLDIHIEYRETEESPARNIYPWGDSFAIGKHKLIFRIPADIFSCAIIFYGNSDSGDYTEWELLNWYIGDGSYSTPIIDNANGKNNAVNNGGLAVEGVSGKGAYFLQGKYADIGTDFQLTPNFTVSVWVKPDNNTTGLRSDIITRNNQFILRNGATFSGGNFLMLYLYGKNETLLNGVGVINTLLAPNVWTNIVIIRNELSCNFYINGSKVRTMTLANNTIRQNTNHLTICGSSTSFNTRPQSVDDLLIFNRALSDTEVQALYLNKANTPKYYSKADWKLEQMENANRSVRTIEEPPIEESGEEER